MWNHPQSTLDTVSSLNQSDPRVHISIYDDGYFPLVFLATQSGSPYLIRSLKENVDIVVSNIPDDVRFVESVGESGSGVCDKNNLFVVNIKASDLTGRPCEGTDSTVESNLPRLQGVRAVQVHHHPQQRRDSPLAYDLADGAGDERKLLGGCPGANDPEGWAWQLWPSRSRTRPLQVSGIYSLTNSHRHQ